MSLETAGGAAAIKFFGVAVLTAAGATALGFLFMWPRSAWEAFVRFASSILCSFTFGPLLAMAVHSHWPGLFASARELGTLYGDDPLAGVLVAAAPFMVLAALPAWWLIGGLVRWLDKRRDKDLAEIALDAAVVVKTVKDTL